MIRSAVAVIFSLLLGYEACAQSFISQKGYFTVDVNRGCVPLTITITVIPSVPGNCPTFDFVPGDNPGNIFLAGGPNCQTSYTYNPSITTTTTLRLRVAPSDRGANNLDEIAITLDPNIQPEFVISSCNNTKAQVLVTDKNYDQYFIDFNDPSGITTPLPAGSAPTAEFTYTSSGVKSISVKGKKLNAANNCNARLKTFTAVTTLPDATIQSLTVTDATTLELDYTPIRDVQYRADLAIGSSSAFATLKNPFFNTTAPQTETFTGLKTNENVYCVRLRKFDPCANSSSVITTTPIICSVQTTLTAESKKNKLSWNPVPSSVTANYTVKRNGDVNFLVTASTSLDDTNIICKTPYSYQVTADYPGNAKSISLEKSVTAFSSEIPEPIDNVSSTVEDKTVLLSWTVPSTFTASNYSIRRAAGNLNFLTIKEVTTTTFTDTEYDGDKPTSYQLAYTDVCDNKSLTSVTVRPLNLTGEVNNDNSIQLIWNAYRAYKDGVSGYQVTKFDETNAILQNTTVTDTVLLDNTPDPAHQRVRYRITAVPLNPAIEKSLSNTAEFTRQARLVFPTAFTPDGKGPIQNETFRVFGEYISGINLQIFDRWGKLLFTTNDLNIPWDGKSEGEDLPQSSYVWRAEITDLLGQTFIRTGSVILLRE